MMFYWIIWGPHNGNPMGITLLKCKKLTLQVKYVKIHQSDINRGKLAELIAKFENNLSVEIILEVNIQNNFSNHGNFQREYLRPSGVRSLQ